MAGQNKVTLTFAGDSQDLERSFERVGSASEDMGRQASEQASKLDRLGEAGGTAETRFLGLGAGISGVSTIMSGDAGPEDYAMALADLGDSIEHTVIPIVKSVGTTILTTGQAALTAAAQHVAAAATTALGWIKMGIQATINAAKMAAAWLISLGPVGLVIAAIAAIIAILVALGVGFDDLKRWAENAWNFILGVVQGFLSWLSANWPTVLAILTGPFGLAYLAIKAWGDNIVSFFTGLPGRIAAVAGNMWQWIVDGLKSTFNSVARIWNNFRFPSVTFGGQGVGPFRVPSFTVGGWALPQIPYLHSGTSFFLPPAGMSEGLAVLQRGESIGRGGAGTVHNHYHIQGSVITERQLMGMVRDEIKRGGLR